MGTERQVVAVLAGFVIVVAVVVVAVAIVAAMAFSLAWDAGQNSAATQLTEFLMTILLVAVIADFVMYFSIRGLGRWAAGSTESRTATVIAIVTTGVFSAAAMALLGETVIFFLRNW